MTSAQGPKLNLTQSFLRHSKGSRSAIVLLLLLSTLSTLVFPLVVGQLVSAIQTGDGVLVPLLLMILAGIGGAVTGAGATFLVGRAAERVVSWLRRGTMKHTLATQVEDLRAEGTGNLASRVGADSFQVKAALEIAPLQLPQAALTLLGSLILMGLLDWVLLLVTVGCFLVAGIAILALVVRLRMTYQSLQEELGTLNDEYVGHLDSIVAIKAARAEGTVYGSLARRAEEMSRLGVKAAGLESMLVPMVTLAQQVALVGVLVGGGSRVISGDLDLPSFIAFLLYLFQLVAPVVMAVSSLTTIQAGLTAKDRFNQIFALPTEGAIDPDPDETLVQRRDERPLEPERLASTALEFSDVGYSYSDTPTISDVSFQVQSKGLTALVGLSGAGKSTIFKLVERLVTGHEGTIQFFGRDIDTLDLDEVRANIAYVDQSFTLVRGSIRDNLELGRPETVTDERLSEVLEQVGLTEVVATLPDGMNTPLGGRHDLSGGQRQRVALGRALLAETPLVLLDEPSSQLDGVNEEQLRRAITRMSEDRAVFVIAHRISTVRDADQIVVLDGGRVMGHGRHDDLLADNDAYRRLVHEQMIGGPEPVGVIRGAGDSTSFSTAGGGDPAG